MKAKKLAISAAHTLTTFPPLGQVTRPTVTTEEAAHYLNRKPQTLRSWACLENGPLRPIRINGRLAWSVSEIKLLISRKGEIDTTWQKNLPMLCNRFSHLGINDDLPVLSLDEAQSLYLYLSRLADEKAK